MKPLSTRARVELWQLQDAVRHAGRDRDRLLRILNSMPAVVSGEMRRDTCLEFIQVDREYRQAVRRLTAFVHSGAAAPSQSASALQ